MLKGFCFFALTTCWKKDGDKDQVHPKTFGPPNKIRSERPVQFVTSFNLPNTAYALANQYSWLENGALKGYPIVFLLT